VSDEEELMRRAYAAQAILTGTPLGDESLAADRALRELTRDRDWEVSQARLLAWQQWEKNGPGQPRVWLGRWQRWMAWDMARSEFFRIADDAAKLRYHENYLRQHGKDFEELVRAATEKSDRLKQDRTAEISSAQQEITAVVLALHHELRWAPERIVRRMGLTSTEVRSLLGLPQLPRRPHA
jgi:hypothetical protein